MKFHPDKCEVIRVGRKRQPIPHDYMRYGQTLQLVEVFRRYSFIRQGKQITLLLFLRRNLQVNSPKIKTLAYFGLVRPLLQYAATVWDP